jgi:protein arginine N-methyltransferase 1
MRIEYHRTMLADHVRNMAFHAALKRVIEPGRTIVADIGGGTGFLGMLAAKLGAKRVYQVETAEIGAVAERLIKHNRIKTIRLMAGHSIDLDLPEPVDVVVSETLGNYPFEENLIETLNDARGRFLKPGGVLIPCKVCQFVAPVVNARYHDDLASWRRVGFDLDFAPAETMSRNNIYVRTFTAGDLAGGGKAACLWDTVELEKRNATTRTGEADWTLHTETMVYGLALWWEADLTADIALSTSPLAPRTHWEQLFLPVGEPIRLTAGETLKVKLRSTTSYADGTNLTWSYQHRSRDGKVKARQAHDLNRGYVP